MHDFGLTRREAMIRAEATAEGRAALDAAFAADEKAQREALDALAALRG